MKRAFLTLTAAAILTATVPLAAQAQKLGLAMANQDTFLSIMSSALIAHAKKVGASVQMEVAQDDVASSSARSRTSSHRRSTPSSSIRSTPTQRRG